ncbi:MAG TPA: hypothetical protein PKD85_01270 [Saprospiraceae bacterium]|nr:hypothetical protein [Saprospiraceae bacterium]
MSQHRVAKDLNVDSLIVRESDTMTIAPVSANPVTITPTKGNIAFDTINNVPFYADGTVWKPFGSQIAWKYNDVTVAGVIYPPATILPLWTNQTIGTTTEMAPSGIWTCPQSGRYYFEAQIASLDLISANTASLVHRPIATGVPLQISSDVVGTFLQVLKVASMIDLLVGDEVYISTSTNGVTTAGTATNPFGDGSGSVLNILRVG